MEGKKNYTEVLIDGKVYTMGGHEETGYLQKIASYMNHKLKELRSQAGFSKLEEDYQQLMLEINMADDYFKAQEAADALKQQKEEIERDVYSLKHELVNTQIKLDKAQSQIEELESALSKAVNLATTSANIRSGQHTENNSAIKVQEPDREEDSSLGEEGWEDITVEDLDDYDDSIAGDLMEQNGDFFHDPDNVLIDELDEFDEFEKEISPEEAAGDEPEEILMDAEKEEAKEEEAEKTEIAQEAEIEEPKMEEPDHQKIDEEIKDVEYIFPEDEEPEQEGFEENIRNERPEEEDIEELTEENKAEEEKTPEAEEVVSEEMAAEEKTPEEIQEEQKALEEKQKREKEELEKKKALEAARLAAERLFQSRPAQTWGRPKDFR